MAFKGMSFHSSFVNYWAKPCLAVFLIHTAPDVLRKTCEILGIQDVHGAFWILVFFSLPFAIYFVCALVEIVRILTVGRFENRIISLLK